MRMGKQKLRLQHIKKYQYGEIQNHNHLQISLKSKLKEELIRFR